jgi:ribonucleoside-diphosphate reductase alpha chain
MDSGFRIGIIGLADAFALLDLDYDGANGRALAALVARSLAQGCHRGSSQLARERGAPAPCTEAWRARAVALEVATKIVEGAAHTGIRHNRLTAIGTQPKLALFANDVADALDPLSRQPRPEHVPASDPQRIAQAHHQPIRAAQWPRVDCAEWVGAQLKLRAAMRHWIDEPIGYPLLVDGEPSALQSEQWTAMAKGLGLPGQVGWRRPGFRVQP